MKVQDETFDLCNDCFRHLAQQIDKVLEEVKKLTSPPRPQPVGREIFKVPPEDRRPSTVNPTKDIGQLLTPKEHTDGVLKDLQVHISMEQAIAKLEASLQRLDSFAEDANEMIHRWSELPVNFHRGRADRERDTDGSGGASGIKADVFWARYMDRDDSGTKRRTVRGGALPGRRTLRAQKKRMDSDGSSSIGPDLEMSNRSERSLHSTG